MSGPPPCFSAGVAPTLTPAVANDVRGPRRRTYRLLSARVVPADTDNSHWRTVGGHANTEYERNVSRVGRVLGYSVLEQPARKPRASHQRLFHIAPGIPATVRGEDQYNRRHYRDASYQNGLMPRRGVFRGVGDPPCPDSFRATHSRCKNLAVAGLPHRVSSASRYPAREWARMGSTHSRRAPFPEGTGPG